MVGLGQLANGSGTVWQTGSGGGVMVEFPVVVTPPTMQLSVVLTTALPVRLTELLALELTCMTQFGAVIVIPPLPVTSIAFGAVKLSASMQYCSFGDVGATMATEVA